MAHPIPSDVKEQIVAAYNSGIPLKEILQTFSVCSGTVANVLKSAGIVRKRRRASSFPEDLTGLIFVRLTVLKRVANIGNAKAYLCLCSCGKECVVKAGALISGNTKSCGCYHRELFSQSTIKRNKERATHRKTSTYIYNIWRGILGRCCDPNNKDYPNWGGRGITVFPEWISEPKKFFDYIEKELGDRPSPKHYLDRIDNFGNYEPGNLRWASAIESARNRRGLTSVEYRGERKTFAEWAEIGRAEGNTHLDSKNLNVRVSIHGWTMEKAMTTPIKK